MLVYLFHHLPLQITSAFALIVPGCHWMPDLSVFIAGAMLQVLFDLLIKEDSNLAPQHLLSPSLHWSAVEPRCNAHITKFAIEGTTLKFLASMWPDITNLSLVPFDFVISRYSVYDPITEECRIIQQCQNKMVSKSIGDKNRTVTKQVVQRQLDVCLPLNEQWCQCCRISIRPVWCQW